MDNEKDKKPVNNPVNGKSLKQETPKEKQKRLANEEYKKRYFAFYDDVKISDREDW